jgi:hypothetical protein
VKLALEALVASGLLHNFELLNAPDVNAGLLADTLEAGVEHSGHSGGGLEFWEA